MNLPALRQVVQKDKASIEHSKQRNQLVGTHEAGKQHRRNIGNSSFVGEGRMTDQVREGGWGEIIMDLV